MDEQGEGDGLWSREEAVTLPKFARSILNSFARLLPARMSFAPKIIWSSRPWSDRWQTSMGSWQW